MGQEDGDKAIREGGLPLEGRQEPIRCPGVAIVGIAGAKAGVVPRHCRRRCWPVVAKSRRPGQASSRDWGAANGTTATNAWPTTAERAPTLPADRAGRLTPIPVP